MISKKILFVPLVGIFYVLIASLVSCHTVPLSAKDAVCTVECYERCVPITCSEQVPTIQGKFLGMTPENSYICQCLLITGPNDPIKNIGIFVRNRGSISPSCDN